MEAIKKNLPSRNTTIFLSIIFGLIALKQHDKRECINYSQQLASKVKYLADRPLEPNQMPDKYIIFLNSPENTFDALYKSKEYFERYIKPVWDAAAINYDIVLEKEGGEIQKYAFNEIKKLREQNGRSNVNVENYSPILGWVALGKEAYGKLLSGIHDGSTIIDVNYDLEQLKEAEVETGETDNDKKEEKSLQAQQIKSLLPEDLPRKEVTIPSLLPSLGYIRLHHYIGFTSTPKRIYEWFTDRNYVKNIGQDALVPLIGNIKELKLPQDYETYAKRDLRSSKILETDKESLNFLKELNGDLSIYNLEESS